MYDDNDGIIEGMGRISICDDELFKDSPPQDKCQLCFDTIPADTGVFELLCSMYQLCCGKTMCTICSLELREKMKKGIIKERCAYCRAPSPRSDNVQLERCKRRMEDEKDLNAYRLLGYAYQFGRWGLSRSSNNALKLWNHAANQGDFKSHAAIGRIYLLGSYPKQDMEKATYHLKLAAIGGDEKSRHIVGMLELKNGNIAQAMKHFIISARAGYDNSLKQVEEGYRNGHIATKDTYSSTLVKHKESKDQMTSTERDRAAYHVRNMVTRACCSRNSQIDDNERDLINFDLDISSIGQKVITYDDLFKDPPPQEDCMFCFLPMPCHSSVCGVAKEYQFCCGKMLCSACMDLSRDKCPFCSTPPVYLGKELLERCMTRIDLLDERAFVELAFAYRDGKWGLKSDRKYAMDLLYQAAELALFSVDKPLFESSTAHFSIANAYLHGIGVEKNRSKATYYWKLAAMGGHESARYNLGVTAELDDNLNRAMKHYMIAAKAGYNNALAKVGKGHKAGYASKDDYVSTLRAFKVCRDNMSSNQRDNAAASEPQGINYAKTELNNDHQRLANFCAICREELNKPSIEYQANPCEANEHGLSVTYGQCGHVFHLDCAQRWLKTHSVCPLCNYEWDFAKIEVAKYYESEPLQLNESVLYATDGAYSYSISYQIDAAIVKTMKECKTLPHLELVSKVQSRLHRFTPQIKEIKNQIKALIDREYIERSADDYQKYNVSASMLYLSKILCICSHYLHISIFLRSMIIYSTI